MLLKRVLKHKTSFICYFEFHKLYLFTFSRLKSLPRPSSTRFAEQLAHVIGPLKYYNDHDYQCYDYQCYFINFVNVKDKKLKCGVYFYRFHGSSAFYPLIRVLLSYLRFTLSSAFYPLIRVLPSNTRSILSSAFYTLIRVLPSHPCFTLISVFYSLVRPSVRPSAFYTFIRIRVLPLPNCTRLRLFHSWRQSF